MPVNVLECNKSNVNSGQQFTLIAHVSNMSSVDFIIKDQFDVVFHNGSKTISAPVVGGQATALTSVTGTPSHFRVDAGNEYVPITLL